jgi:hypothetical protein
VKVIDTVRLNFMLRTCQLLFHVAMNDVTRERLSNFETWVKMMPRMMLAFTGKRFRELHSILEVSLFTLFLSNFALLDGYVAQL